MRISGKILALSVLAIIFLPACARKTVGPNMNQLAADGLYHYENKDLGFALSLPEEFIYYQTQRKDSEHFIDLEFFVPTRDPDYKSYQVPSYAKPITVRIFKSRESQAAAGSNTYEGDHKVIGEKDGRVYFLLFWETIPIDWRQTWNEIYKNKLIDNFRI